jgi:AraC-like DNA-binding protein
MLGDTSLPISVIAARSGFANVANFNRQFKAAKQATPAEYRRQFIDAGALAKDTATSLTERPASLEQKRPQ